MSPLGINVTIVEPAAFRTNWPGPSMRQSATQIDDYADTAGARRRNTLDTYGHQPGDPERASAAIVDAVQTENPPLRPLLGTVALDVTLARHDTLKTNLTTWRDVTLSADCPDDRTTA